MKVLLAEDDALSRRLLEAHLAKWGYDVVSATDGLQGWELFQQHDDIEMAILDWLMPGMDGLDLCQRMREHVQDRALYVLLCTSQSRSEHVVQGLEAGADDFLAKPLRTAELRARLSVGVRTVRLETALHRRIDELREALAHVKQLQKLLPICMYCRRIRDDRDTWLRIESYMTEHADVKFSHGVCDACMDQHYPQMEKKA